MLPLVIDYLRTHSFQELENDHGVVARLSNDRSKASLNYDQILTKNGDKLAGECRGLVVRVQVPTSDDWKNHIPSHISLIARPMDRFYNHGDVNVVFDWDDVDRIVFEKLDGTMIVMYWDDVKEQWCAGTRSVCEADLPICSDHLQIGNMTFSQLFFKTLREVWYDDATRETHLDHFNKRYTYVFELTSPFNRVVVHYTQPNVTLLAIREVATGNEFDPRYMLPYVSKPRTWSLNDPSAIEAFVNSNDPAQLEGAVVCDSRFQRVKVKSRAWVLSSRAKDLVTVSRRTALEAILLGHIDDVLPLLEANIKEELMTMQANVISYLKSIDENFIKFKRNANNDRKTFALQVNASNDWSGPYFNMWEGRSHSALNYVVNGLETKKLTTSALDTLLSKLALVSKQ